ncbi:MAG TPA: hypothetical protein VJ865_02820 [Gemmatimonadaceae bacterium]|nr:hypothetical protein [Gemmatimonadaceae bacterium]
MNRIEPDILAAAEALSSFTRNSLTNRIAALETDCAETDADALQRTLTASGVSHDLLAAAYAMKRAAGQINVVIHALGILLCLPHVLEPGERVSSLSLGAGNTGRAFDLETDRRIGEFKFIHWQGGAETIRQNALFKDLYQLVEYPTKKKKFVYVLGTHHPLRFLNGGRALSSVMSRNRKLWEGFLSKYGNSLSTVGDYYALKKGEVSLVDVSSFVPGLVTNGVTEVSENPAAEAL